MTTGIWTRKNLNPTRRSRNAKVQSGTQYTNGNLYRRNSPILKEYTLSSTYLEKKLLAKCENEGSQLAELCCVRKYRRTGKSSLSQSTRKNANPMQMQDLCKLLQGARILEWVHQFNRSMTISQQLRCICKISIPSNPTLKSSENPIFRHTLSKRTKEHWSSPLIY